MGIFDIFRGRSISLKDGAFWSAWYGPNRNSAKKPVNAETVLTLSTVWACSRILSESAGLCPNGIYQKMPDGGRRPAIEHPAYALLHDTMDGEVAAVETWENVVAQIALKGNAYGLRRSVGPRLVAVDLLPNPSDIMVTRNPRTWKLEYRFTFRNTSYVVGPEKIIHWKAFSLGGDAGLSAIRYGANSMGIAMAADDQAGKQFGGSTTQPGFIQTPAALKKEQREQFRANLKDFRGVDDPDKIMLLEGGFEWKTFGLNPNDLQMLQSRSWSVEDICRFFRVPPHLVGHTQPSTSFGAGLENQTLAFIMFSLAPYLVKLKGRNDLTFLTQAERDAGFYTEFNIDGLLRADSAARAALYSIFAQNGIYSRNEIRAKENMPSYEGGDKFTVQSNLVELAKLGETPAPGATAGGPADAQVVRQAMRNWLGLEDLPPAPALPPPPNV